MTATVVAPWWPAPAGPARVIVPIGLGVSRFALLKQQAQAAAASDADLVEWRADYLTDDLADCLDGEAGGDAQQVIVAQAVHLRRTVAPKPLLFTWRTAAEGGQTGPVADENYEALTKAVIEHQAADLVDVQMRHPAAPALIAAAWRAGVPAVGSWHDMAGTPSQAEIVTALAAAEAAGASIAKVAVTPHNPADVATLLAATAEQSAAAGIPLITMAMGELGLVSRIFGHTFGSQATFAALKEKETCLGQPALSNLRATWSALGNCS